jgi:hypothetical protein
VTSQKTHTWKELNVVLKDVRFNQGLKGRSDLILRHVDGSDTVFHMIELFRPTRPSKIIAH